MLLTPSALCMLLSVAFGHPYEADVNLQSKRCLRVEEIPSWERTFHFNDLNLNLTLEVSNNPSHWVISYIFGILAHERLGYQNITFIQYSPNQGSESINRLTCRDSSCKRLPEVHINLATWLTGGTTVTTDVTNHGPLGPVSQWAFLEEPANNHYSHASYMVSTAPCDVHNETDAVYRNLLSRAQHSKSSCPRFSSCFANCAKDVFGSLYKTIGVNSHKSAHRRNLTSLLLSWYPNNVNVGSVDSQFCGVQRCNCSCSVNFRQWLESNPTTSDCIFVSHQATKISWVKISTHLPLVHQLVSSMRLTQMEFDDLLSMVSSTIDSDSVDRRLQYYDIACEWVRRSPNKWKTWTNGWNRKQTLTIAGLFTLYGKWTTDLHEVALQAIRFVNQDPDYFSNTEYAVTLDVRNLTCVQDIVVNDYFDLLSYTDVKLVGVIAALCSDSIEPVVEVANHRRQLIISPTVESARIVEKHDYPYFFRTVPSMLSANMALIRIFHKWGWRRIAVFRKDDHFFDPRLFQVNGIEVTIDVEMKESQLTYEIVRRNLKEMIKHNSRIFIIEHFAQGTAIVLCAAYRLNLNFDSGYVWFINPWLPVGWWKATNIIPKECTFEEMANITAITFTITHQILLPSVVRHALETYHPFPSLPSGAIRARDFPFDLSSSRSRSAKKIPGNFGSAVTESARSHSSTDYAFYTYESVVVLATALIQLLKHYPSAISTFDSPRITEAYQKLVATTRFTYPDELNDQRIDLESVGNLFSPRSRLIPTSDSFGHTRRKNYDYVSQLRFNKFNERVADYWLLKQHRENYSALLVMIYSKSGIPSTFLSATDSAPSVGEFNQYVTERWLSDVYWGPNGDIPGDGSDTGEDCPFLWLMQLFSVTCVAATVIFSFTAFVVVTLNAVIVFLVYYRRKLKEVQRRIRQPYEDLCAELADIDIPHSDVVLNRRVGQGAFGMVFGGEAKRKGTWESVAVKVIGGKATYESKRDFLAEAKLMRELDHRNVVRLVGVCLRPRENDLYLIMENMLLGDLKTYLLPRRVLAQQSPNHEDIRPETLTRMALDIAEGVAYLHSKFLVHRDIACRNCLVGSDHVVKIGDFGLTRKFTASDNEGYYRLTRNREMPIRWMSPEAIQLGVSSVHSDLWSYGILLYEIITFGVLPYDGLGDVEVLERVKQIRFSILDYLPVTALGSTVAGLIDQCCQHQWQHRPVSMHAIIMCLRENPACIRPFLTDAPPKPNETIDALPFQPGAGACIMSENGLTSRNPTSTVAVPTENVVSTNHSTTTAGLGPARGMNSTVTNTFGTGRYSLTRYSADSFSDAAAVAMRVISETGRRRHKTADAVVGFAKGTFLRRGTNSSGGGISGPTCLGSQTSFGESEMSAVNPKFLQGVNIVPELGSSVRTESGSPTCFPPGIRHSSANPTPTRSIAVETGLNSIRSLSAECIPPSCAAPYVPVKSAPVSHPNRTIGVEAHDHYDLNSVIWRDHVDYTVVQDKTITECSSPQPLAHGSSTARSIVGNALRSVFRILTHSHRAFVSYPSHHPLRSSKSTTSCRTMNCPPCGRDITVTKPILKDTTIYISTSCPPLLATQMSMLDSPIPHPAANLGTSKLPGSPNSAPPQQPHFSATGFSDINPVPTTYMLASTQSSKLQPITSSDGTKPIVTGFGASRTIPNSACIP